MSASFGCLWSWVYSIRCPVYLSITGMAYLLMMYMGNFWRSALSGVIALTIDCREKLQWPIRLFCTGFVASEECAGGTIGGGAFGMGDTLGDGMGHDIDVSVTGVARVLRSGDGVMWHWCAILGGACMGAGVGLRGSLLISGDK